MKRDRLYFSFLCLCCFLFCALDVQAQQDWEALFLILAIAAALVVLRLAKKAGLDIMPCG